MKLTYEEFVKVLKETQDPVLRRKTLTYIFSFEENIDLFSYYFFPDYANKAVAPFHEEIYQFMFDKGDGAMGAPRGHGKSTVVGLFFLMFLIVNKLESYIVYVSANYSKTVQFLEPIRTEFKNNERLRFVYGEVNLKNAFDNAGRDREDCFDVMGCRIEAASFDQNIRGFKYGPSRPSLIILDDIETDERVINPDLRLKDENKLNKIIIPSLDATKGRIKMIGTILHWDSLLVKKIRLYRGKIYKACNIKKEDGKVSFTDILWPELFPPEKLEQIYKSIGSVAFSSEMLNNPIENEASLIKGEWIRGCYDESRSYGEDLIVDGNSRHLGCDFAFGDRVTNDKSAFVDVVGSDGIYSITHIDTYKGLSITEQFEIISKMHKDHNYDEVVMEENSIKSMSKNLYEYEFPYYLIWTGTTDTASKLKPDIEFGDRRHTVGKKAMILRLATQFENGTISIPYKTEADKKITNQLYEELTTFALNDGKLVEIGVHADIPIALGMALERAVEPPGVIDFG